MIELSKETICYIARLFFASKITRMKLCRIYCTCSGLLNDVHVCAFIAIYKPV